MELKLKSLFDIRDKVKRLENEVGALKKLYKEIGESVVDEMQSRKIKSIKLDGVANFSIAIRSFPKCHDKIALGDWLEGQGYGRETVLAFNAKKFQGFYNELLDNKKELPPGTETFTEAKMKVTPITK